MRKLLMLAATAVVAVVFAGVSVSAASASGPRFYTPDLEAYCPEVSLDGSEVSGGCLTEDFEGGVELGVFSPYWYLVGSYDVSFDLVVDSHGSGYVVDPSVDLLSGAYGREACDTANGTVLPWAVDSRWSSGFWFAMDVTVGLRTEGSGPGGACTQQVIALDATQVSLGSPSPTVFDQTNPSANLNNGHWESDNTLWFEFQ